MQPKPYTGSYPVTITYHFQFNGRRLDSTNCGYMAKMIEDALIHCDVIPDDAPKYVKQSIYITDGGDNEVDVIIKPCAI